MTYTMMTAPSEIGELGAQGIRDMVRKATAQTPVAVYVEAAEPPVSWSAISDAGWDGVGIVEDQDGATVRDLIEIAREWGFGCIPQPLVPSILAKRLSPLARTVAGPVTFAVPRGGESFIPGGTVPGVLIATSLDGDEAGDLVAVPTGEPDGLDLVGRGVRTADATTHFGLDATREISLVLTAEALGCAERLLAESISYVQQREQFGRPVGSFQAVKHKLADAAIAVESAETALIWGSQRPADALRTAAFAADRCIDVAEIAVQTHGGLGFTWEAGLHFPYRRILSAQLTATSLTTAQAPDLTA